jgi:hypothetical protein
MVNTAVRALCDERIDEQAQQHAAQLDAVQSDKVGPETCFPSIIDNRSRFWLPWTLPAPLQGGACPSARRSPGTSSGAGSRKGTTPFVE